MITFYDLVTRVNALGDDAILWTPKGKNLIDVTLNDFYGFNDDWSEEFRDFDNPDAVNDFLNWLKANADYVKDNFYHDYYFGDICVRVGYASFDI